LRLVLVVHGNAWEGRKKLRKNGHQRGHLGKQAGGKKKSAEENFTTILEEKGSDFRTKENERTLRPGARKREMTAREVSNSPQQ